MASKMTTLRLSEEDLKLISKLHKATGITALSELIRESLRDYFQKTLKKTLKKKKSSKTRGA